MIFFLNDLPPATFLVFRMVAIRCRIAAYFFDQVRGVVLQNGYLNLPPVSISGSQWPESETLSSTSACALAAKWVRTTAQWANSQTTECHVFPCIHSPVPFSFFLPFSITSPSTHPHCFYFLSFLYFLAFQLPLSMPPRHTGGFYITLLVLNLGEGITQTGIQRI